jgi:hypothetical protein
VFRNQVEPQVIAGEHGFHARPDQLNVQLFALGLFGHGNIEVDYGLQVQKCGLAYLNLVIWV